MPSAHLAREARYDARKLAIEVIEPQRELSTTALANIKTVRSYNAFGEVARETSALGLDGSGNPVETGSLTYTYNTMGRLIKRESPQVAVTSATGATSNVRPTEEYYYDRSGRMLASRDANGNLTRYTLLAGTGYGGAQALIAETVAADGGVTRVRYDIHGDARQIETPLYNASTAPQYKRLQSFDKLGRLIQLTQEGGLVQNYEYDGLGQRTKYWNSQLGSSKAELTAYDHQGRIAQVTTMGGDVTAYAYGWNGALATSGMATYGGWTKTTTYANFKTLIESTDVFGRATSTTDLGGNVSNFVYDKAGRLLQKTGGNTRTYQYYNTGKLKYLGSAVWYEETTAGPLGGVEDTDYLDTDFEYDILGNLTKQRTGEHGAFYGNGYYDGEHEWVPGEVTDFDRIVSTQIATYDALGRMISWDDLGYQETRPRLRVPPTSHDFQYDANGNVRRSLATYRAIDAQGAYASTDTTQDYWYAYDAMNRMVISKGQLVSGQVARGTTGVSMNFDANGRRAFAIIQEAGSARREDYTYDADGRLIETKSGTSLTAPGTKRADFTYDYMGHVTLQRDYDTNGTTVVYSRSVTYNDKGQVASDSTATKRGSITYTANSNYDYGTIGTNAGNSTYALGSPLTIMTYNFENGVAKKTNKTVNTYTWREGPTLDKVEYWNDWVGAPTVKNTSTYTYDIIGGKAQLKWVNIADGRPRVVVFMYDQMGQVIKRDEQDALSGGDPHEVWYRFSGRQIGYVGNNGSLDSTYAQSIANRTAAQGSGAFFNGSGSSTSAADFDLASDNLNSYAQGSTGGMYVVNQGDTLSSIASNLWGDAALWYKLAEANGLTAESELPEGLPLIIPTGVMRDSNTASTFKPYDPNEIMGNLSPTAVAPPKKGGGCGVIGQILMVIVAVVVSIYAPQFAAAMWSNIGLSGTALSVAATATAGAAASIASQAVGIATGVQEKFSWNAVALSALTAGISPGGGANWQQAALNAMKANVITQAIGVATGLQKEFSWAGVAAAGVAGGIGKALHADKWAQELRNGNVNTATITANIAIGGARAIAAGATRSLIDGSDFGDNMMAALPDVIGQTIGEAIAGGIGSRSSRSGQMSRAEHGSRTDEYNAALDAGASPDQLQALAHELGLDGDNVPMWQGGTEEPIEVQPLGPSPYGYHSALALVALQAGYQTTDPARRQAMMELYEAESRLAVLETAVSVGAEDVVRLYLASGADIPRAIGQRLAETADYVLNDPDFLLSDEAIEHWESGFADSSEPPTYMEFMTSMARAATGITSIENMIAHHQNAMRALEAGDWDTAVSEAQGAMFEGTMAATVIAGNLGTARAVVAEARVSGAIGGGFPRLRLNGGVGAAGRGVVNPITGNIILPNKLSRALQHRFGVIEDTLDLSMTRAARGEIPDEWLHSETGFNVTARGRVSTDNAIALGLRWVGPDYRLMSSGEGLVSLAETGEFAGRTFRFSAPKPRSPVANTGWQANYAVTSDAGTYNIHLNVVRPRHY